MRGPAPNLGGPKSRSLLNFRAGNEEQIVENYGAVTDCDLWRGQFTLVCQNLANYCNFENQFAVVVFVQCAPQALMERAI